MWRKESPLVCGWICLVSYLLCVSYPLTDKYTTSWIVIIHKYFILIYYFYKYSMSNGHISSFLDVACTSCDEMSTHYRYSNENKWNRLCKVFIEGDYFLFIFTSTKVCNRIKRNIFITCMQYYDALSPKSVIIIGIVFQKLFFH